MSRPEESGPTLFDSGVGAVRALTVDALPAAVGRWQPTRAGVLNSWAWTDEAFLFSDGWAALVGPNGSGKSLTSALWIPTMIDGDASQSALSMAKRGLAGTLADRHHYRTPSREKTGVWWLEFGRRDEAAVAPRWMTLGLWIRWRGAKTGSLERVWFTLAGRIGADLDLHDDGAPVDIDALCEQLSRHDGRLFTNNDRLRRAATRHLPVHEESAYADAVRLELFAQTDRDQLAALTTVLRTLRSVSVNDRMTAEEMHAILTSALPPLPSDYVELLAKNLAQSDDLLTKVNEARRELVLLNKLAASYRRYASSAAGAAGHTFLAAGAAVEQHERTLLRLHRARDEQAAQLAGATRATEEAQQKLEKLRITAGVLQRRADGHPGGHLPQLGHAVAAKRRTADIAANTAAERDREAEDATRVARSSHDAFAQASGHLDTRTSTLRVAAERATAAVFLTPVEAAAEALTGDLDVAGLRETTGLALVLEPPRAWIAIREKAIAGLRGELALLSAREVVEAEAEARHAIASDETEAARTARDAHERTATETQRGLISQLSAFDHQHGVVLGSLPQQLIESLPLDADAIQRWAADAFSARLSTIDLPGATTRSASTAQTARHAAERLRTAGIAAAATAQTVNGCASDLRAILADLPSPPTTVTGWITDLENLLLGSATGVDPALRCDVAIQDATQRGERLREAIAALDPLERVTEKAAMDAAAVADADLALSRARDDVVHQRARRDAAVAAYLRLVGEWTGGLQVLQLQPGEVPDEPALKDGDVDVFGPRLATALRRTELPLRKAIETASRDARDLATQLAALDDEIEQAQATEKPPEAPRWRADRTGRAGAPLWALVDFAPDLAKPQRAALEGALLTSGILDAWIEPRIESLAGDLLLTPGAAAGARTLADVLRPQPTDGIDADHIGAILRQVAYDDPDAGSDAVALIGDQLRNRLLTARAPAGWQPRYIGATARAEQRRRLLLELRRRRKPLADQVEKANARTVVLEEQLITLLREAALPDLGPVLHERRRLTETQTVCVTAEDAQTTAAARATRSRVEADTVRRHAAECCRAASAPLALSTVRQALTACVLLDQQLRTSRGRAEELAAAFLRQHELQGEAAAAADNAEQAREAAERAQRAEQQLRESLSALPEFADVRAAYAALDEADAVLRQAADRELTARGETERCHEDTEEARRGCRDAARVGEGRELPIHEAELDEFGRALRQLSVAADEWAIAAERLNHRRPEMRRAQEAAAAAATRAASANDVARTTKADADADEHRFEEERRLHERSFQDLMAELVANEDAESQTRRIVQESDDTIRRSSIEHARLDERAHGETAALEAARQAHHDAHGRICELFDFHLIDDIVDGDPPARPAELADATAVSRQLSQESAGENPHERTKRRLGGLTTDLRMLQPSFIRMGRTVSDEEFGTGGIRRLIVTDTNAGLSNLDGAGTGRTLNQAIAEISRALKSLQQDYDEQLRTEVKGAVFTQLRVQINRRIEQATKIVAAIRETLDGVRTGVERVGVRLRWTERTDDPLAQQALAFIQGPNLDGDFDPMYEFFTARLRDEKTDETASEHLARIFDYRTWFTWKVEITHSGFSDETRAKEVFQEVTRRKNPLDALSTGEKRLVTMLPLLAAIRSCYLTPGFTGPRLAFIDELDAALDDKNLRTLLALLRDWDLDVLATLPTMGRLLVPEVRSVAIHKIVKTRSGTRFSVPHIWQGSGMPVAVRIGAPPTHANRQPQRRS